MKQCIDIYTACYADNKEKKLKGTGFGALIVTKTKKQTISGHSDTLSYLDLWMEEMATVIEGLLGTGVVHTFESVALAIHTYEMNTGKVLQKLKKVYDEVKQYGPDSWDIVELKLRRANKTYYPYHNAMLRIVMTMLQYNVTIPLNVILFTKKVKGNDQMTIALQKAEAALNRA